MTEEDFLKDLRKGTVNLRDVSQLDHMQKLVQGGLFPFSVATRFKFSSLEEVEVYKDDPIRLGLEEHTPQELFELYCFSFFNEACPNAYGVWREEFSNSIDTILGSYHREWFPKWGNDVVPDVLNKLMTDEPLVDIRPGDTVSTPAPLVENMLDGLKDLEKTVVDPSVGLGCFLLDAKRRKMLHGLSEKQAIESVRGHEKCARRAYIAAALLDPNEVCDRTNIFIGEPLRALRNPKTRGHLLNTSVVGNFPFQEPTGKKGTATIDLSGQFVELIGECKPSLTIVVIPEKKTSKVANTLADNGLMYTKRLGRSSFPGINLDICYVIVDPDHTGTSKLEDADGVVVDVKKGDFIPNILPSISLFEKTKEACAERSLGDIFSGAGAGVSSGLHNGLIKELPTVPLSNPDAIEIVLTPVQRVIVSKKDLKRARSKDTKAKTKHLDVLAGYNKHKVILGSAASRTALGNITLADPSQVCGWTACRLETGSREESENLKSYMETGFVRALVYSLKTATANSKTGIFNHIPLVDLSVQWTDKALYSLFNLTEQEIVLVEKLSSSA